MFKFTILNFLSFAFLSHTQSFVRFFVDMSLEEATSVAFFVFMISLLVMAVLLYVEKEQTRWRDTLNGVSRQFYSPAASSIASQ